MSAESCSAYDLVNIRVEDRDSSEEHSVIRTINEAAFGGPDEADLVDKLRTDGHALLSLVAELDAGLVGHILFSRMWIRSQVGAFISAVALAPVAVLALRNRRAIAALGAGGRARGAALRGVWRDVRAELAVSAMIVLVASVLVAQVPGR